MSDQPGISLYEACESFRKRIDAFEQYRDTQSCRRGEEEYPLGYPTLAEWARQFRAWEELVETDVVLRLRDTI